MQLALLPAASLLSFPVPFTQTIRQVREAILESFDAVDRWFEEAAEVLSYRPEDGGWTVSEVLEHIMLTTHFLLIVANKGCEKARKRALTRSVEDSESDLGKLAPIGQRGSFVWNRPDHMEPKGIKSLSEIRAELAQQQQECLSLLEKLRQGEGSLFKVRMSVNDSGRIDLYQWTYFMAQHAKRHLGQMEENLQEWKLQNPR